jgi:hypothetical protein
MGKKKSAQVYASFRKRASVLLEYVGEEELMAASFEHCIALSGEATMLDIFASTFGALYDDHLQLLSNLSKVGAPPLTDSLSPERLPRPGRTFHSARPFGSRQLCVANCVSPTVCERLQLWVSGRHASHTTRRHPPHLAPVSSNL